MPTPARVATASIDSASMVLPSASRSRIPTSHPGAALERGREMLAGLWSGGV
ncbi:hypothetical protein AB0M60_29135 [Micromonospora wenchangensis]